MSNFDFWGIFAVLVLIAVHIALLYDRVTALEKYIATLKAERKDGGV